MITIYRLLAVFALLVPYVLSTQDLYSDNDPIITKLNYKTFDRFVNNSNYTVMVKFYAPWCKYCIEAQPAFEKAAKKGSDYAKFAVVNCDLQENKRLCGENGVQSFPALNSYATPKDERGRAKQVSYRGGRDVKGIIGYLKNYVKNYVTNIKSMKNLIAFTDILSEEEHDSTSIPTKVLVVSDKKSPSLTYKGLAIEFSKSDVEFAWIDSSKSGKINEYLAERFPELFQDANAINYPTLITLSPNGTVAKYPETELKFTKKNLVEYLSTEAGLISDTKLSELRQKARKAKSKAAKAKEAKQTKDEL